MGVWYILLFVGKPNQQSVTEHALSQLAFSFTESGAIWHFSLLALLPIAFFVLAMAAWRSRGGAWRLATWQTLLALASTLLVLLVMWEAALFAGPALLLLLQKNDG